MANFKFLVSVIALLFPLKTTVTQAQIIPDNTLGNENSVVTELQNKIEQISGGAIRGNNLFHSFLEFSISEGASAHFANPQGITNILSRVTGNNISEILGTLKVLGEANVFLINPNGIMFGPNASLDISGSFVASSASAIVLSDGTEFSATNPQTPPLLTITTTAPVGLRFQGQPGIITSQAELATRRGQTIALIGGDITLEAATLRTKEGRVELGSVLNNGFVSFLSNDQDLIFNYEEVEKFGDINLSQGAYINTRGNQGGDIQIRARQLTITKGSQILSDSNGSGPVGDILIHTSEKVIIEGTTSDGEFPSAIFADVVGTGAGGELSIETEELIVKDGAQISATTYAEGEGGNLIIKAFSIELSNSGLFVDVWDQGNGGNITIETQTLQVTEGAQITTSTFGEGDAGNIDIQASESITLEGSKPRDRVVSASGILSSVEGDFASDIGDAGNLTINTGQLNIIDGAQIATTSENESKAGNITITATESILLSGTRSNATLILGPSGIFVSAEFARPEDDILPGGASGELLIETGELIVEKGATITANTFGPARGGDITLNVDRLIVRNGGFIRAGSLVEENALNSERGDGGNLLINASESIEIWGSGIIGNNRENSQLRNISEGTGNAGNITINTPELIVRDGGRINVDSTGEGDGGNITIHSENITLNQGIISAESTSGRGGNITVSVNDTLEMRFGSQISTTAGNEETGGDGGNITLNPARFIVARPEEDSNIEANAFTGDGGRIEITTEGILGIEPREEQTEFSDITASSEFGVDGEIIINRITTDPTILADEIPGPTENITFLQACSRGRRGKIELFDLGRGGLPTQPEDPLSGSTIIAPWIPLTVKTQIQPTSTQWQTPPSATTSSYTIFLGYGCQE